MKVITFKVTVVDAAAQPVISELQQFIQENFAYTQFSVIGVETKAPPIEVLRWVKQKNWDREGHLFPTMDAARAYIDDSLSAGDKVQVIDHDNE